jgi:type I restriction enzyme S subunit
VKYRELTLDQLGEVARGRSRHRPRDAAHLYGGPYPFIQTGDVKKAGLYLTDFDKTYSEAGLAQSKLWPSGTLCITIAANIADTSILGINACFPDSVIGFTANTEIADTRFVKYLFDGVLKVRYLSFTQGAAQDNLSQEKLLSIKFPVPELRVQKQIAEILSAYDDQIENNWKRIALLEQAARLLYREWFVHFRFPGHEHVKIIDGLPEGWERKRIAELAEIFRGKSYSSQELVEEGGQPFVNLKCLQRFGGFRVSGLKGFRGEHKDHHLLAPGDIVIAVTDMTREAMIVAQAARVPRTVGEDAIYSMDLVKAVPKGGVDLNWLYGLLRFSRFSAEVREEATGATVLHLKPKHIEAWSATVPSALLIALFAEQFGKILNQIDNLELQSEKLSQARDLLLPRLMNGEIAL